MAALRTALLLCLWLLLPVWAAAEDAPSRPPAPRERLHVYLLLGQSNMAGRGVVEARDRETHPRIFAWDDSGSWVPARDPLDPAAPVGKDGEVRGVGPGISFARAMAARDPEAVIGLVQCAVGGSPIRSWRRGGSNFRAALARARLALEDGVLRGVLWHQGESDTFLPALARRYQSQLDAVVREWRGALGEEVPFLAGRIAEYRDRPAVHEVNRAIQGLPDRLPRTAVVDARWLETDGPWHFTAPAARQLGRRYAAAMLALQAGTGP